MGKHHYIQIDPSFISKAFNKLNEKEMKVYLYLLNHCNSSEKYTCRSFGYEIELLKGQFSTNGTNIAKIIGSTSRETGRRYLSNIQKKGLIQVHPVKLVSKSYGKYVGKGHTIVTVCGISGAPIYYHKEKVSNNASQIASQNETENETLSLISNNSSNKKKKKENISSV